MIYNEYFASMNTGGGFECFFDEIFPPQKLDSLYIIKGGSGTGKSTVMKSIAKHFYKEGYSVEGFVCSSDINSYDGVIIDSRIAIIDGTSPHTTDPLYFGAVDEIVNFGECLNPAVLKADKEKIVTLVSKKKESYKKGYSFLSAASKIKKEIKRIASEDFDFEKMQGAISRYIKQNNISGKGFKKSIRLISGIGPDGEVFLDSFEKSADKICCITNSHGCEGIFFDAFCDSLKKSGVECVVSYSPYISGEINGIFIPSHKTALVMGKGEENTYNPKYKIFNLERFLNKDVLGENRSKLRFAKKCSEALISGAVESFKEAKSSHEALEKIYKKAVNFDKVTEIGESLIQKIENSLK